MLPIRYLRGLDVDPFEGAPGVFAVPHARHPGAYRYLCSYDDGRKCKARIFELLARYEQPARRHEWVRKQWDLHHVVEGQHFADVDFRGQLSALYKNELPCVLIEQPEHHAYNSLLHSGPTDELYRDGALPPDVAARSRVVAAEYLDVGRRGALRARVQALAVLYRNAYAGDRVLQRVAQNVLDEALALL